MENMEKEYFLQWIIADYTPFEYSDKQYFISTPTRRDRFLAERLFISTYNDATKAGLLEEKGILELLFKNNQWSNKEENDLQNLTNDIENIKVNIFEYFNHKNKFRLFKKALKDTIEQINILTLKKQTFDIYSAVSVASMAKQHYLLGSSIYKGKNKPLWNNWWASRDDSIIQHCYSLISEYILNESEFREIARSNIWRNIWNTRKGGSVFGKSTVDLSISQRQLLIWSGIYDSVYKSSDCPADEVIEDDDALDGWMIVQKRNRDKESNRYSIENSLSNDKIRHSDQIFVMCDPEISDHVITTDPSKVYDCNDIEGKIRFRRIMKQIEQEGCVPYMSLKDTQTEIYRRSNELKGI